MTRCGWFLRSVQVKASSKANWYNPHNHTGTVGGQWLIKNRAEPEPEPIATRYVSPRRLEYLKLFGYVLLRTGETLSLEQALIRLKVTSKADLEVQQRAIEEWYSCVKEWHFPEAYTDVIRSIGEVDSKADYPRLGIKKGDVLRDPKLRYVHPRLRLR